MIAEHWGSSWSSDLLVGWGGQSAASLHAELDELLAFRPPHVSIYGLTVEPGTPLERLHKRGPGALVDDDTAAALDEVWTGRLEQDGLERYEVSNFARPGQRCLHNQAYWRGQAYLGLGPGASSSEGQLRWSNRRDVNAWISAARSGRSTREHVERLSPAQRLLEVLGSGLRTREGLSAEALDRRFSPAWRAPVRQAAAQLLAHGLIHLDDRSIRLADAQLSRADRILIELVQRWPGLPE